MAHGPGKPPVRRHSSRAQPRTFQWSGVSRIPSEAATSSAVSVVHSPLREVVVEGPGSERTVRGLREPYQVRE